MARVVHFTAAGFKPQLIEVAPEGEELESKRSHIIDMFSGASDFNGDLSQWDVSNVTSLRDMF
jgi:surface protein